MRIRKTILFLLIFLFTGCSIIDINTNNYLQNVNNIIKRNNKYTSDNAIGYQYKLPVGVTKLESNEFNEVLISNNEKYYLYADVVSYYYKTTEEYKVDKNGEGHCYTCMGCRSFLTPYVDPETNLPKYYGRFNQGVVTINLPDVALSSGGDFDKFWQIFDERLELCYRALMARHNRLMGTLSDAAPILWRFPIPLPAALVDLISPSSGRCAGCACCMWPGLC